MRLEDKKLGEMALAPEHAAPVPWRWPLTRLPRDAKKRSALYAELPMEVIFDFSDCRRAVYAELWRFFDEEGVLGVLWTDDRGEGALFFSESSGEWQIARPMAPPIVAMPPEGYDQLARLAEKNVAAKVTLDAAVQASDKDETASNVVGEIPGGPSATRW